MKKELCISVILFCLLPLAALPSCLPPGWWEQPKTEDSERLFFKGSASGCATEQQAYQQAYNSALQRISDHISARISTTVSGKNSQTTSVQSSNLVIGASIDTEFTCPEGGKWSKWVLVSFPRVEDEKAKKRADAELAQSLSPKPKPKKVPLLVLPFAFGSDSQQQFPDVVEKYRHSGYGNAIWQTLEDLLYDRAVFQISTLPSTNDVNELTALLKQRGDISAKLKELEAPHYVLDCNVNFLAQETAKLRGFTAVTEQKYHATVHLRLFDIYAPSEERRYPVTAEGDAIHEDLQTATNEAATNAVAKLIAKYKEKLAENL